MQQALNKILDGIAQIDACRNIPAPRAASGHQQRQVSLSSVSGFARDGKVCVLARREPTFFKAECDARERRSAALVRRGAVKAVRANVACGEGEDVARTHRCVGVGYDAPHAKLLDAVMSTSKEI